MANKELTTIILRNPIAIHKPLAAYSHQAEVSGNAKWLIMSAQIGMDKEGHVPEDVYSQIEIAFDNIQLNLEAAGMDKNNLVKLVFYFAGAHDVEQRRSIIKQRLCGHEPCMTVLYVAGLAGPLLKVEVEAWACSE